MPTRSKPETAAPRDERSLLEGCRRGDSAAWEELIRRYRRLIYSIPFACGLGAEQADDVFQRVAVKLLESVATIRDASALVAWISTTTRRECWAASREGRRWSDLDEDAAERIPDESEDAVEELHRVECEHALALALDKLGEPCKGLLTALYIEDPKPSYEELSRRTGFAIGSLGPTRGRCLTRLKKLYLAQGGPSPFPDAET